MIIRDLWTAKGPTLAELKILERLGRRRRALEAVTADDGDEATVIARALATLDDMEECLCEEGRAAPRLARGWEDLDQLEARLTALQAAAPTRRPEGSASPQKDLTPANQGVPIPMISAIETIRAVARRAAEDPSPGCFGGPAAAPGSASHSLLPRVAELVKSLFAGTATGTAIRIVAQALAAFLPLLDRGRQPDEPAAAPAEPELTTKDEARIGVLLQERAARARQRGAGDIHLATAFARPDIPPASAAKPAVTATPPAEAPPAEAPPEDVWNDLLDLTSEALETFIRFRNAVGVQRCLELLDLLAEAFGVDWPEAA